MAVSHPTVAGVLAVTLLLGACATKMDHAAIGPYPSDYKGLMKSHVERTYFDPYSLRNVSISNPTEGRLFFRQGWIVCVEANGKNRMGGYTGIQRVMYLINNDRVVNQFARGPGCDDPRVIYQRWPEAGRDAELGRDGSLQQAGSRPARSQPRATSQPADDRWRTAPRRIVARDGRRAIPPSGGIGTPHKPRARSQARTVASPGPAVTKSPWPG